MNFFFFLFFFRQGVLIVVLWLHQNDFFNLIMYVFLNCGQKHYKDQTKTKDLGEDKHEISLDKPKLVSTISFLC